MALQRLALDLLLVLIFWHAFYAKLEVVGTGLYPLWFNTLVEIERRLKENTRDYRDHIFLHFGLRGLFMSRKKTLMVLLTVIGRISDGLLLTSSVQCNLTIGGTQSDSKLVTRYQNEAKQIMRKLSGNVPLRACIESGNCYFYYQIDQAVCTLVLCERNFPSRLAFSFLEEISRLFLSEHGQEIQFAQRPYAFIEFETCIQKAQRRYSEEGNKMGSTGGSRLGLLNNELHEVQKIMVTNIEEVLGRGEALSALDSKANALSSMSHKYRTDARDLNRSQTWAKAAVLVVFIVIMLLIVKYMFF